ncbi:hypothetical protein GYMLUDRAFT_228507 [Collybiopsis luxurians FD-317 M1]|uniref:Zn(2)-C6 fungal-type domain-containing protein n=1 Tax=Collybiopsis luxurians FD-317 M1 TaxID=944289 RepID=A0A0D0CI15_9AGAR|nr:hypothetical protein GYMLUDRAFT_228507 [Collybiopsis luxurians FD-317 M1]
MVASIDSDIYSPFRHPVMVEEGPQSSEDGSGLHSPVFESQFPRNDTRYQVEIDNAANILAHFDYTTTLIQPIQPPLIDTALETPSPTANHVNFFSDYSIPPRSNHLGIEYAHQSSGNSRPSLIASTPGGEVFNFTYSSSEQRSSGRQTHDPSLTRPSGRIPMYGDQGLTPVSPSESSTALALNRSPNRREVSTVVIACRQCRSRKIRCDSARPVCTNCHRRKNICEYDAAPKRRGPDKRPGTRRRSCKKRPADGSTPPPPKRKKTVRDSPSKDSLPPQAKANMSDTNRSTPAAKLGPEGLPEYEGIHTNLTTTDETAIKNDLGPEYSSSLGYNQISYKSSYARPLDVNLLHTSDKMAHSKFPGPPSPMLESQQREWWARNLNNYSIKDIADNAKYLFNDTGHLLSFLNIDFFLETLFDTESRTTIRPALVYSILAMAMLMKSSEAEYGADGRAEALLLRESAQASLEASFNSGWIDTMLVEAGLILTLFEMSIHPQYNPERIEKALEFLDNIIHHLGLTSIDSSDPDVNSYPAGGVPVVMTPGPDDPDRRCTCIPLDALNPPDPVTSWSYPPPWDSSWSPAQIRDEECRRVCWCALSLVANFNAQCVVFGCKRPELFLNDCSNFTLLFPGEVVDRASPTYRSADSQSQKESVWALYCRSMLLWNYSNYLREQPEPSEENAENAQESWNETLAIEDSLNMHICNLDTALIYSTREYIYNSARINITQVFRSLHGLPNNDRVLLNRRQAQDWLYYQDQVMKRVKLSIQDIADPRGHQLTRRPFQATWFSNQLSICLLLYHHDPGLVAALDLAKSFVIPLDVMNVLWPCPLQQRHCDMLRQQLIDACTSAGMEPPLDPEFSIPPALQSISAHSFVQ